MQKENYFKNNEVAPTLQKKNAMFYIRDFLMAIILVWLVCPYQVFFNNWLIYGGLWILWIGLSFISDMRAFNAMLLNRYTMICFIWPLVMFFLSFFNWAEFSIYQFTIPFILIAFVYYAKGKYYSSLKFFLIVYICYALLIDVYSINKLWEDPNISRILANSDQSVTAKYASPFMANFSYINNLPAISALLVYALLKKYFVGKSSILVILLIIVNAYLLILAEYTIALLMFAVFTLFVIIRYAGNEKKFWERILYLMPVALIIILSLGPLLTLFADLIGDGRVADRISSIGEFLTSGTVAQGSDFQKRWERYERSLIAFFNSPVFGVGRSEYMAGGLVGGHSEILDNFGYYGIFIGGLFVVYLISAYKNGKKFFNEETKRIYTTLFVIYFINCLLNACYTEEMMIVTYFLIPSFLFIFQEKKKA